jgi:hypothetical protein
MRHIFSQVFLVWNKFKLIDDPNAACNPVSSRIDGRSFPVLKDKLALDAIANTVYDNYFFVKHLR